MLKAEEISPEDMPQELRKVFLVSSIMPAMRNISVATHTACYFVAFAAELCLPDKQVAIAAILFTAAADIATRKAIGKNAASESAEKFVEKNMPEIEQLQSFKWQMSHIENAHQAFDSHGNPRILDTRKWPQPLRRKLAVHAVLTGLALTAPGLIATRAVRMVRKSFKPGLH